jgi:hypothetical protein
LTGPPNARTILPVRARSDTIAAARASLPRPTMPINKPEAADKNAIAA